jgi:hypothetical protein
VGAVLDGMSADDVEVVARFLTAAVDALRDASQE